MNDEWKTVTREDKKRIAKGRKRPPGKHHQSTTAALTDPHATEWSDDSLQTIVEKIHMYKCSLKETDFFKLLVETVENAPIRPRQLVCYGIGNFARLRSSPLWQMACALNLWDFINSRQDDDVIAKVFFFDPCMSLFEASILAELGVQVIHVNERGKRNIQSTPTIFFMPHCPMPLYFNMLVENWENLDKILLFGNNLSSHANRLGSKIPRGFHLLFPFMNEEAMSCSRADLRDMEGDFDRAFNDCFLTTIVPSEELPEKPANDSTESEEEDIEVL
jgi:hypothetical protein